MAPKANLPPRLQIQRNFEPSPEFLKLSDLIVDGKWMLVRLHLNKVTLTNEKSLLSLLYTHKADHLTIASAISCLRRSPDLLLPSVLHGGFDSCPLRLSYNALNSAPSTTGARTLFLLASVVGLWRVFDVPAPLSWVFSVNTSVSEHLNSFYVELLSKIDLEDTGLSIKTRNKRPAPGATNALLSPSFRMPKLRQRKSPLQLKAHSDKDSSPPSVLPTAADLRLALLQYRTVAVRRALLSALAKRRVQRGGRSGDGIGWLGIVERVCMEGKLEKIVVGFVGGFYEDRLADIGRLQDVVLQLRSDLGDLSPPITSPLLSPLNLSPFLAESDRPQKKSPEFGELGGERNRKTRRISEL